MPKPLNQNQVLNYLADLPLLLGQARVFLDLKNRQGKETDFNEIDQLLRVYALNLTLLSLEEFESLPFEKVFERLEWLFEQEKLIGGGSVPVNLAELEEELSRKKEKEAQEANKLAKDLANRRKLLKALKETQIQPEAQAPPDWQTTIESLPENEELANFIQKTAANPKLSIQEKEAACQEVWERFLDQQTPTDTLITAKQQSLSLESFNLLAGQLKQPPDQRTTLIENLKAISEPLTEPQVAEIQKELTSRLAAYLPLAQDLGWEALAKIVARETRKELPAASLEQISWLAEKLAKTAESTLPAKSLVFEGSVLAPPAIIVEEKVIPFVGSPEIPGNPKGNHWQIKDPDNQPSWYYLTTTGTSPAELEKLGKIQQMVTGDPHSSLSQSFSQWAIKLKQFQTQYFSQEAIVWQTNRLRAIFNTSQVLTPLSKISQQAKAWFFQTSFGQSVKLWLAKTSQKSLEALWTTAKTGIKTAVTKGLTAFLTRIGLQAVANTVAPVIGGIIAFLGEKVIRKGFSLAKKAGGFILSGFGLTNVVMEGITGQREVKDDSGIGKLAMVGVVGTFILLGGLTLFESLNIGSGLLGRGAGGPPSAPGLPVPKPPECDSPRHLAEEVICCLTTGVPPCNQEKINISTWSEINRCFDSIDLSNGQEEIVREIFANSVSKHQSLQCVGFASAIQYALGLGLEKDLPHGAACDYAHGAPPLHYRFIEWNEKIEVGDLAIWDGALCGVNNGFFHGHIAVVIEIQEAEITVAEAIGDDLGDRGDLLIHSVVNDGRLTSPRRFLRYSP